MREVPIFIASSVKEFAAERRELSAYLDELNDVYKDSGARLVWDRPENMSHGITRGGSQLAYDRKILNCRFFILIVGQKLGGHTLKEFELALDQFVNTESPIILPYFYAKNGVPLSAEVAAFRDRLRREQQYYTNTFTDFEQIKRTIQLDLVKSGAFENETPEPDSVEALLEQVQGKVRREIEHKQTEIKWLENQKPTERLFMEITKSYEAVTRLVQKAHVEPDALLDYMGFLWKQHLYDRGIELGHWLENEYRNNDPGAEKWAHLYNRLGVCYYESNRHEQAERYYREDLEMERRMADADPAAYEPNVALTCNNLAALLSDTNRMEEAETFYRDALKIRRRLADANPAAYEPNVALTCNNLGILLKNTNRMEEAETFHREALEIRRRLADANPAAYEPNVALTCNNLGILLKNTNRMEEAETFHREALEIRRRLAEANPTAFEPDVADTCNNLGTLLEETSRIEEAETFYREALDRYRRLADANPAAYKPNLAMICNNLAVLLILANHMDIPVSAEQIEQAEPYLKEAETIWRQFAQSNPYAYETDVAIVCYNWGVLEYKRNNPDTARPYFEESLALFEKFPHCVKEAQMCRDALALLDE